MYSCIQIYGGRFRRMFRYVDALCLLPLTMYPKTHIARARHLIYFHPDSYYTNVRKLCRYYNMFESISFVIYNVESILLSSQVVWRKTYQFIQCCLMDLYFWSRLLLRQVSPWVLSCGQSFSHIKSNQVTHIQENVECLAIIFPTFHSLYRKPN